MPTFQSVSHILPFNLKYNDDHKKKKKKLQRRVKDSTSMTSMISASFYLTVRLSDAFIVYNEDNSSNLFYLYCYFIRFMYIYVLLRWLQFNDKVAKI